MSIYKYVFIFCVFFVCCEKNDFDTWQLCNGSELIDDEFSVLSFNRLNGTSIHSVSKVIETVNPDVIGLQESFDVGVEIADRFNYCFYGDEATSLAILSKHPIEVINDWQFKINLNDIDYINFFNIHFPGNPYQPYDIRDTLITTSSQAIHQAEQTRGQYVNELVSYINAIDYGILKEIGYEYIQSLDKWSINDIAADFIHIGNNDINTKLPPTLKIICDYSKWNTLNDKMNI